MFWSCIWALTLFGGIVALVPSVHAQSEDSPPIRVESNDVVLPVLVLDKGRVEMIHDLNWYNYVEGVTQKGDQLLSSVAVTDLQVNDFQVFEDGKEQQIERVATAHYDLGSQVRWLGSGQGRWVLPDLPLYSPGGIYPWNWTFYLITYSRPPSVPGSCHHVSVNVRPSALVYTREEYCNSSQPAADPLKGTKLGDQLLDELEPTAKTQISLSMSAFESYTGASDLVTNVVIGFPANHGTTHDCDKPEKRAILGVVYRADGSAGTRFSDTISLSNFNFLGVPLPALVPDSSSCGASTGDPYQYEIQIELPPGKYNLKAVFFDGKKFGRAEIALVVENHDPSELATSDITLGRSYRQIKPNARGGPVVDAAAPVETYTPLVSRGFEVTPTANTIFHKGDPFDFYFEVYKPIELVASAAAIQAHLRIVDMKTNDVVKTLQPVDAAAYAKPGDPVIPIGGGIDISTLPNGSYELQVQATDSTGKVTPWRGAAFTVNR